MKTIDVIIMVLMCTAMGGIGAVVIWLMTQVFSDLARREQDLKRRRAEQDEYEAELDDWERDIESRSRKSDD